MSQKAVVLVSGGLDSAVMLAKVIDDGYDAHALTFDYGQQCNTELGCAQRLCRELGVPHKVVRVGLGTIGGSALTNPDIPLDLDRSIEEIDEAGEPGNDYVPARNLVFLSMALAYAESIGARDIFIGTFVNHEGPDNTPEFFELFEMIAAEGTREGRRGARFRVHHFGDMYKADVINLGRDLSQRLNLDIELTISCYRPVLGQPCGRCGACVTREAAFRIANEQRADENTNIAV